MELNDKNIKKIKEIILFTAILVICLWKYDVVLEILVFIMHVLWPFIIGGIAFVLNVPMNFIQRHLFPEDKVEKSKTLKKLARPVSMILVLVSMIGVVVIVMFILIP